MALMPSLFLGHGSPMYAIEPNQYTDQWGQLGQSMPTPSSILILSAHWYTPGIHLTAMAHPSTIHDFGGFPQALFNIQYPAPGSPQLAEQVQQLIAPLAPDTQLDEAEWGLDHGAWSVLKYLYPQANIPCVQMSIDLHRSPAEHFALAQLLQPLRHAGVLLLASGNVVHNLSQLQRAANAPSAPWASQFNDIFKAKLLAGDYASLINWHNLGESAQMSIPSAEHYLPAIYTMGSALPSEKMALIADGIEMSAISMLSFGFGFGFGFGVGIN